MPSPDWDLAPATVHPPELYEKLKSLRFHPSELTGSMLLPFVKKAAEIEIEKDKTMQGVMPHFEPCEQRLHNAATYLQEHSEWDFMAVYHDAIDHQRATSAPSTIRRSKSM